MRRKREQLRLWGGGGIWPFIALKCEFNFEIGTNEIWHICDPFCWCEWICWPSIVEFLVNKLDSSELFGLFMTNRFNYQASTHVNTFCFPFHAIISNQILSLIEFPSIKTITNSLPPLWPFRGKPIKPHLMLFHSLFTLNYLPGDFDWWV